MHITVLRKDQIYYAYMGQHDEIHLSLGQILVRNLSAEMEGVPETCRVAEGQMYVLPRAGWMMLSAQADSEILCAAAKATSWSLASLAGWLQARGRALSCWWARTPERI